MSNIDNFQYSFRSYDMTSLNEESKDILDAKDKQLEFYLSGLSQTLSSSFVPQTDIRYGTVVFTLPAVGGFVSVIYSTIADINQSAQFDASVNWIQYSIVVTNGDYPANPAEFAVQAVDRTRFRLYHTGNGNVGNGARANFVAFGIR